MGLTWFFLGTRYSLWQLFGAAICIIGLGLVFLSDAGVGGGGDILSSIFYNLCYHFLGNETNGCSE